MLNIRVEVTQQLIRDYRNRKRGHAPQNALGTLTVFVPNKTVQDQLTCRSDAPTMDIKKRLRFFRNCGRQQCSKQFFRTFVPF